MHINYFKIYNYNEKYIILIIIIKLNLQAAVHKLVAKRLSKYGRVYAVILTNLREYMTGAKVDVSCKYC